MDFFGNPDPAESHGGERSADPGSAAPPDAAPETTTDGTAGSAAEATTSPEATPAHAEQTLAHAEGVEAHAEVAHAHADAFAPAAAKPIAPKEYYSISEVCDLVGLKPHVLRYWESQFPVLNPSKNRSGNRVYQRKEIKLILLVQHLLYKEKYTIEGARQRLDQLRRGGKSGELAQATSHALDSEMTQLLKDELQQLLEVLAPAAPREGRGTGHAPEAGPSVASAPREARDAGEGSGVAPSAPSDPSAQVGPDAE